MLSTKVVKDSRYLHRKAASVLAEMARQRHEENVRLGRRIAHRRDELGLTQDEAAERAHVTLRAFQRWEAGESRPYARNLKELAQAFGLDTATLLGEEPREEQMDAEALGLLQEVADGQAALTARLDALLARFEEQDAEEAARAGEDAARESDEQTAQSAQTPDAKDRPA